MVLFYGIPNDWSKIQSHLLFGLTTKAPRQELYFLHNGFGLRSIKIHSNNGSTHCEKINKHTCLICHLHRQILQLIYSPQIFISKEI